MTVPDFMPVLSAGPHSHPREGACVMEYVSLLAGEPFSDRPECTHPMLAVAARMVNDRLRDEDRHLLVPLIPRLIGTAVGDEYEPQVSRALAVAAVAQVPGANQYGEFAVTSAVALLTDPYRQDKAPLRGTWRAVVATRLVDFLTALLDEHARITGHVARDLTPDDYAALAAATR